MKCEHNLFSILCFIVTLIKITSGDECYGAEFSEDVVGCADFDNDFLNCDTLKLAMVEDKEEELGLNGVIKVFSDIEEGAEMVVEIWKILDIGKEFLYHMEGSICENLNNEGAPWYPLTSSMKIKECPIKTNEYDIKDMSISMNKSDVLMNHEMLGDYNVQLSITKEEKTVSCYELGVTIIEYSCNVKN